MKKTGVLNSHLSRVIASMGHSDRLVVCDSGFPVPRSADIVDLALTKNVPRFAETLKVILSEAEIEAAIVAEEVKTASPATYQEIQRLLPKIPISTVSHEEFKKLTQNGTGNISFVRTGEATPYANVILIAGVTFD